MNKKVSSYNSQIRINIGKYKARTVNCKSWILLKVGEQTKSNALIDNHTEIH